MLCCTRILHFVSHSWQSSYVLYVHDPVSQWFGKKKNVAISPNLA